MPNDAEQTILLLQRQNKMQDIYYSAITKVLDTDFLNTNDSRSVYFGPFICSSCATQWRSTDLILDCMAFVRETSRINEYLQSFKFRGCCNRAVMCPRQHDICNAISYSIVTSGSNITCDLSAVTIRVGKLSLSIQESSSDYPLPYMKKFDPFLVL